MPSKELIEKVARAICFADGCKITGPSRHKASDQFGWDINGDYKQKYVDANWRREENTAAIVLSTILAALQEPTEGMLLAAKGFGDTQAWQEMLNASALGEQSDG